MESDRSGNGNDENLDLRADRPASIDIDTRNASRAALMEAVSAAGINVNSPDPAGVRVAQEAAGQEDEPKQINRLPEAEEIIERMRCSMCRFIPHPNNTLVCEIGHYLCNACFKKIPSNACPKDVGPAAAMTNPQICHSKVFRQRFQLFDYLYFNSYHRCEFYGMGCRRNALGSDMATHRAHCIFRPNLPCPMSHCKYGPFSFGNYSEHLRSIHEILSYPIGEQHLIQIGLDRINKAIGFVAGSLSYHWICAIFPAPGIDFLLMAEEYYGGVAFWMTAGPPNGTRLDLDNFDYNMTVLSTEKGEDQDVLRWAGQVQPFSKTYENTLTDGTSLTISKQTFMKKYMIKIGASYFFRMIIEVQQLDQNDGIEDNPIERLPEPDVSEVEDCHANNSESELLTESPILEILEVQQLDQNDGIEDIAIDALAEPEATIVEQLAEPEVITVDPLADSEVITVDPLPEPQLITIDPFSEPEATIVEQLAEPEVITVDPLADSEVTTVEPLFEAELTIVDALAEPEVITVDPLPEPQLITIDPFSEPQATIVERLAEPEVITVDPLADSEVTTVEPLFEAELTIVDALAESEVTIVEPLLPEPEVAIVEPFSEPDPEITNVESLPEPEVIIAEPEPVAHAEVTTVERVLSEPEIPEDDESRENNIEPDLITPMSNQGVPGYLRRPGRKVLQSPKN